MGKPPTHNFITGRREHRAMPNPFDDIVDDTKPAPGNPRNPPENESDGATQRVLN